MSIMKGPGEKGFEPLTCGFGDQYSTVETIPLCEYDNKQYFGWIT